MNVGSLKFDFEQTRERFLAENTCITFPRTESYAQMFQNEVCSLSWAGFKFASMYVNILFLEKTEKVKIITKTKLKKKKGTKL